MKKLIVLAIVLGFVFVAPGFAKALYGVAVIVENTGSYTTTVTMRVFKDVEFLIQWLERGDHPFPSKMFRLEPVTVEELKKVGKEKQPCYFIDRDGKKTEIECK